MTDDKKEQDNYVTDKKYYMDKRLKYYLDMIIKERLSNKAEDDALIICEGEEGTGKSSMAGHIGYYIAEQTGRAFSGKTYHLNTDEMMQFAAENYRQVICWDEPAISGLSDEWWNKEQRKLKKLLTMIRQHQHCYIFNFARFTKFSEFFIVERSIAMIKTFKKNRIQHGHFLYFNTKAKENLYYDWRSKHQRNYEQHALFVGRFFTPIEMFLTPEEYAAYKIKKDKAMIDMLDEGKSKRNLDKERLILLRYDVAKLRKLFKDIKSIKEYECFFHSSQQQMRDWGGYDLKYPELFKNRQGNEEKQPNTNPNIYNSPRVGDNNQEEEDV